MTSHSKASTVVCISYHLKSVEVYQDFLSIKRLQLCHNIPLVSLYNTFDIRNQIIPISLTLSRSRIVALHLASLADQMCALLTSSRILRVQVLLPTIYFAC